ncbi:MAG TPA: universal stress protein [Actinomycetota bacterium]|nr:universal stress protein [Actinomycetota bacterium]
MRTIIVGVDGSDASIDAARHAGRLAADLDAALVVVHARQLPVVSGPSAGDTGTVESIWKSVEEAALLRVTEALAPFGVRWKFEVGVGEPATLLERAAQQHEAEMIVVGSRGHTATQRLLLGSVSTRLVHHADRPVLVVR